MYFDFVIEHITMAAEYYYTISKVKIKINDSVQEESGKQSTGFLRNNTRPYTAPSMVRFLNTQRTYTTFRIL